MGLGDGVAVGYKLFVRLSLDLRPGKGAYSCSDPLPLAPYVMFISHISARGPLRKVRSDLPCRARTEWVRARARRKYHQSLSVSCRVVVQCGRVPRPARPRATSGRCHGRTVEHCRSRICYKCTGPPSSRGAWPCLCAVPPVPEPSRAPTAVAPCRACSGSGSGPTVVRRTRV